MKPTFVSRTRWASSAVALGLVIAACGGGGDAEPNAAPASAVEVSTPTAEAADTESSNAAAPTESAQAAAPADAATVVPASLQFTAPLVGGGEIDVATLAGKPTIFWFWAPT